METKPHTLGQKVQELRRKKGWSRPQLAERCGITSQTIFNVEHDLIEYPSTRTLAALARVLGVKVSTLVAIHFDR